MVSYSISCIFFCSFLLQTIQASISYSADVTDKESWIPSIKDKLLHELHLNESQLPRTTVTPTIHRNGPITGDKNPGNNVCQLDSAGRPNTSTCCFHPIRINFTEIGWNNWIIEPSSYQTGLCFNGCPDKGNDNNVPEENRVACSCKPISKDLSILYAFNHGEIRKRILPDMIVTGCQC